MRSLVAAALALLCGCDCSGYRRHPHDLPDGGSRPCPDDPTAPGCPCDDVEPVSCYDGPAATLDVGVCNPGLRSCIDGAWSECVGDVVPSEEICDDRDEDCDGEVDDGVTNACGDCRPECREETFGPEGEVPFEAQSPALALVDGDLTLAGDEYRLGVIWVPDSLVGTISRIDTTTRVEQARYRTGPLGVSAGLYDPPGDNPSRTSVDYRGDAYVANRAFEGQASVTKILERDCPDADGDGSVETSSGHDDVLAWERDECVAWNTPVGDRDAIARALAVQARVQGDGVREVVWVGLYNEQRYVELDAENGEPTGVEVDATPCFPYGAAIDRDGMLWSASAGARTCRFDTADPGEGVESFDQPSYGITVDVAGRVWVGWDLSYWDPITESWTTLPGPVQGYGVAADTTSVWMGGCRIGGGFEGPWAMCRVDLETFEAHEVQADAFGVAVDFDGGVWGFASFRDSAFFVDPETEGVEPVLGDCVDGASACLEGPYAYSDMTGLQLRNATNAVGTWREIAAGCEDGREARWVSLRWEAEVPEGARLGLQVRTADDPDGLADRPWIDVASVPPDGSPAPIAEAVGNGGLATSLELRATLFSDVHGATPIVHELAVLRSCGAGVE